MRIAALALTVAVTASPILVPRDSPGPAPTLLEALHQTPEDDIVSDRSARIVAAFNDLTKDTIDGLDAFYGERVHFEDPLGSITGLPDLKEYYAGMYENVKEIRFDFTDETVTGDTHAVAWTMKMRVSKLNRGRPVVVEGMSLIKFGDDDKVRYHRDYFDMGSMVYEHVPVLKFFIKQIKKRLSHE